MLIPNVKIISRTIKINKLILKQTKLSGGMIGVDHRKSKEQLVRIIQLLSYIKEKPLGLAISFRLEYIFFSLT